MGIYQAGKNVELKPQEKGNKPFTITASVKSRKLTDEEIKASEEKLYRYSVSHYEEVAKDFIDSFEVAKSFYVR